ncbi:hypothetical protein SAMN05421759_101683 [Roseivivax lentus]|uniref:Uncharacterized protein n=1 Tax=Roseivivax lentus TaxID=633194 RepID=A0A1N7KEU6_9RHOB|nr:hypothetical protein [Roseivivax lentus]SIS59994.1 hypothetical protein SAMN05421759_101683 [Roseivivax lentus]
MRRPEAAVFDAKTGAKSDADFGRAGWGCGVARHRSVPEARAARLKSASDFGPGCASHPARERP